MGYGGRGWWQWAWVGPHLPEAAAVAQVDFLWVWVPLRVQLQ